ncbi:RsmB/NOP family class I SAM-dependent RNA methyltransferase [Mangrovicella endophytica]|uniref:RsmB/NOP family class I SAM-dependent RNA methyltransferase n=1 Tax=Mangrovicella endophytica TaxID=2066697 RepID=UPI000C9E31E5|nr:RsmB/NOP family class I SAM-dependent RNA methyltransferase [Mangrovicella endophytica]
MRLGGRMGAAIEVLADMESRRRPVADALKDWGLSHRFAGSGDRAAIGNLVYDVLRRRRSLGWRMDDASPRALVVAALLDAGSAEALSAQLAGDRFAPELPEEAQLQAFADRDLALAPDPVRADVPDWLAGPLRESLGHDWVEEAAALSRRPPLDMRANTLKADRAKVLKALEPFAPEPTPLAPEGLRVPPIAGDGRHPNVQVEAAFQKGWFEIQDEGSQLAARLAGATPGAQILDLCAGAGGKTLALAAAMEGRGQVHAYDADRQRLAPIYDRLQRAEARNVQVHAPRDDLSALDGAMDLVLVDAPCTGSGTWRRRPDAKWRLSETALAKRIIEQDAVLDRAAPFVKPGGRLVYITCSVLAAENADRVKAFTHRHPEFQVLDAEALWREALPDRPTAYRASALEGGAVLTLTPRTSGTDGFFFASLERK